MKKLMSSAQLLMVLAKASCQVLEYDLIRGTQKKCEDLKFIRLVEEYAAGE